MTDDATESSKPPSRSVGSDAGDERVAEAAPTRHGSRAALDLRRRVGVRARARGHRPRQHRAALRALHRRQVARARSRASTSTPISPATEEKLAEVAEASAAGRRRRGAGGARGATRSTGRSCAAAERGKYIFRIARAHPGEGARARHRRDDGRRQADQGVARRRRAARRGALLLPRGLGRQARLRVPGPHPRAARRRRADHPVELPAAHGGVEDRARARVRQHRACSSRPRRRRSPRSCSRRSSRRRSCRRASSTSSPARARPARRSSNHPRRRQGRLHRLDRRRQAHPARRSPARDKKLTLELGGKAANIVFADAPIDQAVEGIVNGIYFNQGHVCCAGSRLLVEESVARRSSSASSSDRMATLRVGDPLDKNTDVGAINSQDAARQDPRARRRPATTKAPSASARRARFPSEGFWFAPTFFTGVSQSHRIAREEIFGPVLSS